MDNFPRTVGDNESRPSDPTSVLVIVTVAIFVVMLFTGHIPFL